jgi:hypothetical protein
MGTFPRQIAWMTLALLALPSVAAAQGYPQQAQPYPGNPYPQQAQPYPQGGGYTPAPYPQQGAPAQDRSVPPGNPACGRLEAQLAAIDRGAGADPARAERTRRIEETLNREQTDLDRAQAQWQRLGCQPATLFSIFANQSPQCGPLGTQISQIRAAIDRTTMDLERSRHSVEDDMQRQGVLGALAQNNCGPQYRTAAQPRPKGILETLFGGGSDPEGPLPPGTIDPQQIPGGGGYRTLCVRTCDGYYFPISFSTSQSRFGDDEQTCQKLCPATEAVLYSHRNPGEDVAQAVSSTGRIYKDLANAFRYRREYVAACSCKQQGQTWAEALGTTRDSTIERGDIVVTEEKAKALSQPRNESGRTTASKQDAAKKPAGNMPIPSVTPTDAADAAPAAAPAGKRPVRVVGPTFTPAQPQQ